MDQEQAIKLLSERLDTYDDPQFVFVDCICWFADDFARFKKGIINEILRRIRHPPILPQKHIEQPILPLYYLVDAISKNCEPSYSAQFGERLPQVFEQSLHLNDKHLNDKLFNLVEHWKLENIFSEYVIESLQECVRNYKKINAPPPPSISVPNIMPQSNVNFIQETNQIPVNDYMHPINPNVEVIEQSINDSTEQISITPNQSPDIINDTLQFAESGTTDEDHRMSREWMKSSAKWEQSKFDINERLVRDLDIDDHQRTSQQSIKMVRLTPENANARCISCSGTFDRCVGPNGEECLKDAIFEEGKGYIHEKCKNYEAETDENELIRRVLNLH
ncbi:hypothetical protein M9Y10_016349 [Tritrichomonas musculus]|uniref:CID domain-containing protein n=1 Tax=Tritrichomonas musculus TaxID=1915356 RepID=A0ABR2HWC4_9EUKA